MSNCAGGGGAISCWIAAQADVLTNIANNVAPVQRLITGAAYLMGIGFAFKAIACLKQHGENRAASQSGGLKEPLMYLMVAAVFIYFPTAESILLKTTFGYSNVLAYGSLQTQNPTLNTLFGPTSSAGQSLSLIIQTIGLIAFIRGWVLISRSATHGQTQGGTSKGLMHIIGGILAMNIMGTLEVLNNTLYGT